MCSRKIKAIIIVGIFLSLMCIVTIVHGATIVTAARERNNDVILTVTDDTVNPSSYKIAVKGSATPAPEEGDYFYLSYSTMTYLIYKTDPLLLGSKLYVWIKHGYGSEEIQLCNGVEVNVPASASVFADFSNAKIETSWDSGSTSYIGNTKAEVTGVTIISENYYFIYLSKTKDDIPDVTSEEWKIGGIASINQGELWKYFELAGSTYISILEEDRYTQEKKIQISSQEIFRKMSDGKLIKIYFFNDETTVFYGADQYHNRGEDRHINYKVGVITDNNVLKALRDNQSNAYSLLMQYAKNDSGIGSGQLVLDSSYKNPGVLNNLNIIDEKMYYVYAQSDSKNGKYFSVEDVDVYYGMVGETIGKNLYDKTDSNFKYVVDEGDNIVYNPKTDPEEDLPPKLPFVGNAEMGVVIAIISLVITAVIYKKIINKYKEV